MNSELKPCPFCGCDLIKTECIPCVESSTGFFYSVRCINCYSGTDGFDHEEEAIEAWNRRDGE